MVGIQREVGPAAGPHPYQLTKRSDVYVSVVRPSSPLVGGAIIRHRTMDALDMPGPIPLRIEAQFARTALVRMQIVVALVMLSQIPGPSEGRVTTLAFELGLSVATSLDRCILSSRATEGSAVLSRRSELSGYRRRGLSVGLRKRPSLSRRIHRRRRMRHPRAIRLMREAVRRPVHGCQESVEA